jgi:hypothetical protein
VRHSRVLAEYGLRGMKKSEAENLYQERECDETPIIQSTCKYATKKISLNILKK